MATPPRLSTVSPVAKNPAMSRVGYRFWQGYIENALGRATVEPCWQRRLLTALCRWNLQWSVRDAGLRRRLTPDYQAMCKRQVLEGHYYQAIQKPGVLNMLYLGLPSSPSGWFIKSTANTGFMIKATIREAASVKMSIAGR